MCGPWMTCFSLPLPTHTQLVAMKICVWITVIKHKSKMKYTCCMMRMEVGFSAMMYGYNNRKNNKGSGQRP